MGCIGLCFECFVEFIVVVDCVKGVEVEGVFIYLFISDVLEGVEFICCEIDIFMIVVLLIEIYCGLFFFVYLVNFGVIFGYDLGKIFMVCVGIVGYGYDFNFYVDCVDLYFVLFWISYVIFVKIVSVGDIIGYGRIWIVSEMIKIVIVLVGYVDGLF